VVARLDTATRAPLTLVTAPAGWGKTAALAEWTRRLHARHGDERPVVRWVAASAAHGADIGARIRSAISTGTRASKDLIETVERLDRPHIVIVDDVRENDDANVLSEIESLVRHGTGQLRLVLSCRTDLALPLYRWRVNGSVSEMRTNDLAFTIDETAQLLAAHDVVLPGTTLYELHAMTEGWPAGVRLAALSMRDHPEPERVLDEGSSFSNAAAEFLTREVIDTLPPDAREILLDTSVTPLLNAELVEAITGRADGARILAEIDAANAFLSCNAGPGGWYRYHALFARILQIELRRHAPQRVPQLHQRAARWHARYGLPAEALHHALLGGDRQRAVEVLERHWPDIVGGVRYHRPCGIAPPAPRAEETGDPRLMLAFAAERLHCGDLDGARDYLHCTADAEVPLTNAMRAGFAGAEGWLAGDYRRVRAATAALVACGHGTASGDEHRGGDTPRTENHQEAGVPVEARALGLLTEGQALLRLGELGKAGAPLDRALVLAQRAGMPQTQLRALTHLAVLESGLGHLRSAARLGRRALVTADRSGMTDACDLGWVRVALASVYAEWDRIAEADRLLDEALDLAAGDPDLLVSAATARARLRHSWGQIAAGLDVLHTARREVGGTPLAPAVQRALALTEAELRISGRDLGAARWLLAVGSDSHIFPAWAACIEASAAIIEGKVAPAAASVARYAKPSVDSSLTWTVQAALLAALAGCALGGRNRVPCTLQTALDIAEEEGFRRPFLIGGYPVRDLLATFAPLLPVYHPFAAELAAGSDLRAAHAADGHTGADGNQVEPLTKRELTVLRYLQGTMSILEIASTLYLSVNTVKTHVRNIYRKLHAGRRREAVKRARDLGLL
jgi:LuxR family maltose regulon positive regulatory protein